MLANQNPCLLSCFISHLLYTKLNHTHTHYHFEITLLNCESCLFNHLTIIMVIIIKLSSLPVVVFFLLFCLKIKILILLIKLFLIIFWHFFPVSLTKKIHFYCVLISLKNCDLLNVWKITYLFIYTFLVLKLDSIYPYIYGVFVVVLVVLQVRSSYYTI